MHIQNAGTERDQLERGIDETRARLLSEFHGRLEPETITRYVDETADVLKGAAVSEFVPLFIYRTAREQLALLTRGEG